MQIWRVKIIKKKIIHSILIFIVVILSIITSLVIAVQDPVIQKFAVRIAGGWLSEKTGAEVKIGKLYVSPNLALNIENFSVKDQQDKYIANIGELNAKVFVSELLLGNIHVRNVELRDSEVNLIKYEGADGLNFQFIADAFKSDKPKDTTASAPLNLRIDHVVLENFDFLLWDQDRTDYERTLANAMDFAHLDIDDINLDITNASICGDSISADINMLTAQELSGFQLKSFKGKANVSQKGIIVDDLHIQTNNSQINLDLKMLYNSFAAFSQFVDSVHFASKIYPSDIVVSDIGPFAAVLYKMPNRVLFEGGFVGPIEHFRVEDFDIHFGDETHIAGDLTMHPLNFENGLHTLKTKTLHYTYDDIVNFYIPGNSVTIPLPESLRAMNRGDISFDFRGSYREFLAKINLTSGIGNLALDFKMDKQDQLSVFKGLINAQGLDIGTFANASNIIGTIDLDTKVSGKAKSFSDISLDIEGDAYNAQLLENSIDDIKLNGTYSEKQFVGLVNIKDNELDLDFNGLVNFADPKSPIGDFSARINHADFNGLNLMHSDSTIIISSNITANMVGFNLDKMEGTLSLDSTRLVYGNEVYEMNALDVNIVNDNLMQRRFNVDCDFFNYEMAGLIDFASMGNAFKTLLDQYVSMPRWEKDIERYKKQKNIKEQDFFVNLTITNPDPLTKLFMPALRIAKNTTLNGTYTSRSNMINLTLRSKKVSFNDYKANNVECKFNTSPRRAMTRLNIDDIVFRDSTEQNPNRIAMQHFTFENNLQNDSIFTNVRWDDRKPIDHNMADFKTVFVPTAGGGFFNIKSADIVIYDTLWTIAPDNLIHFDYGRINFQNFNLQSKEQRFTANGQLPFNESDTLQANFKDFDISDFDFLFSGLDLDGFINGNVVLGSLNANPYILANLGVKEFGLNKEPLGDIEIDSYWDNEDNSIYIDASLYEQENSIFKLSGNYGTKRNDNLDFRLLLNGLRLNTLAPFTQSLITRLQGMGKGDLTIKGSLKKPVIEGDLNIVDGGCQINYLKTFYTFNPTIKFSENLIELNNLVLHDTLGHTARVIGDIRHKYLKDFQFNITLLPKEFLAMQTTLKDSPSYYGTAVADGMVKISGPLSDIGLAIKVLTRDGTKITIPFNSSSTVKENDFITFVNRNKPKEEDEEETEQPKKKSHFGLDLNVDVNPSAAIKIILPKDMGAIDATGDGNIQITVNSSGDFFLIGDYNIDNGKFQMKFKDIISKTLKLQKGGTISWTGDPKRGIIDVTGIYSTNAAVGSLGISTIDSTAAGNKVNVNCMIHLTGQLLNPSITFGIRLPNASDDLKQTIYSELDTTNQSAMTQQAVSLLILNTFTSVNSSTSFSGTSGYFDLLTNQLTNWISQLSENFDMGIHYRPRSSYTNEEVQIALKTQLFDNRLTIETNFGMITQNNASSSNKASNIVGEVDVYYKISEDGKLQAHFYNHSNSNNFFYYHSYDKIAPYTQGLGLSYSHSFSKLRDILRKNRNVQNQKPAFENKEKNEKEGKNDNHNDNDSQEKEGGK